MFRVNQTAAILLIPLLGLQPLCLAEGIPNPPPVLREPALGEEAVPQYTLPAGTGLHVLLQTPVDTAINQPGDTVEAILTQNLYLNGQLFLSKNTRLIGMVSRLEPPFQGRHAVLAVRFTELIQEDGARVGIAAHVRTENSEHFWGGHVTPGTKPVRSTQRVMGIGEYNRIVFAGPRAMGSHIRFDPGEHWIVVLEQPATITRSQPEW